MALFTLAERVLDMIVFWCAFSLHLCDFLFRPFRR